MGTERRTERDSDYYFRNETEKMKKRLPPSPSPIHPISLSLSEKKRKKKRKKKRIMDERGDRCRHFWLTDYRCFCISLPPTPTDSCTMKFGLLHLFEGQAVGYSGSWRRSKSFRAPFRKWKTRGTLPCFPDPLSAVSGISSMS